MHYYQKNIGDYAKKAGRLSILQHGVYNLLIDACYDREQFPTEEEAIDWVWASTPEEIQATKFVLKKFFELREDGRFYQNRIEEEIYKYQEFCEKQSANGKKGGRPKKEKSHVDKVYIDEKTNPEKPTGFLEEAITSKTNPEQSQKKPKPLTTNHKPITNKKNKKPLSGKPDVPLEKVPDKPPDKKTKQNLIAREILDYLNLSSGKHFRQVETNLKTIRGLLASSVTREQIQAVIDDRIAAWRGTECEEYIRPATLFAPKKFEQYLGNINWKSKKHPAHSDPKFEKISKIKKQKFYLLQEIQFLKTQNFNGAEEQLQVKITALNQIESQLEELKTA